MKLIACLMIFSITSAFAKSEKDFNKELLRSVDKEIRNDDDSFKAKIFPARGPASVQENQIEEEKKIDKKDRQIGPRTW